MTESEVAAVWRYGQVLIGPAARRRLEGGEVIRFAESAGMSLVGVKPGETRKDERLYEFAVRPTGKAGWVAVYGRPAKGRDWLLVDGPWPS